MMAWVSVKFYSTSTWSYGYYTERMSIRRAAQMRSDGWDIEVLGVE